MPTLYFTSSESFYKQVINKGWENGKAKVVKTFSTFAIKKRPFRFHEVNFELQTPFATK